MQTRFKSPILVTLISLCLAMGLSARSKTDLVILENGDTIHGEIKGLERGILKLSTDWMGTIQVEWVHIQEIRSDFFFQVVLSDGTKSLGSIQTDPKERALEVISEDETFEADHLAVVGITPVEDRFLDRISFSIELGASYYSSNVDKKLSLGTDVAYRTDKYAGSADYNTLYSQQGEAPETQRNELKARGQRFFGKNWSAIAVANLLQSQELNLDLRSVFGGGLTKELIRTNKAILTVLGGAAYNREQYTAEPVRNSMEGLSGISFQTFQYDKPEFDVITAFYALPSFTDLGRVRLEVDAGFRFKLFHDFYLSASLFENYDSRPPEGNKKNDFGVQTTFGWTFN